MNKKTRIITNAAVERNRKKEASKKKTEVKNWLYDQGESNFVWPGPPKKTRHGTGKGREKHCQ
jgi:hypothetical protein